MRLERAMTSFAKPRPRNAGTFKIISEKSKISDPRKPDLGSGPDRADENCAAPPSWRRDATAIIAMGDR